MNPVYSRLKENSARLNSFLCIGLDPDPEKMPLHFPRNLRGIRDFLYEIIDHTSEKCIAYKPNISFFEALGVEGLTLLQQLRKRIPAHVPVILDGKRGDIGNTSKMQSKFIFDHLGADAVTLHPYMGEDSLLPFFQYRDKFHFVLALTSNPGAADFELLNLASGVPLYYEVAQRCAKWHNEFKNVGLVVGATQKEIKIVRQGFPQLLFLIPGIGQQGGQMEAALKYGKNQDGLAVINASRSILYASQSEDYLRETDNKIKEFHLQQ